MTIRKTGGVSRWQSSTVSGGASDIEHMLAGGGVDQALFINRVW